MKLTVTVVSIGKNLSGTALPKVMKPFLAFIPIALIVSGCVSKRTYDRDIARLTSQLQAERGQSGSAMTSVESRMADKSKTLAELTDRYIKLQAEKKRSTERLNTFRGDIEELQRDISELKLVLGKNVERFPSTTANEMLIKLIDMEYRVQELLRKEAEEVPPLEGLIDKETGENAGTSGGDEGGEGGGGARGGPSE